MFTGLIAEMGEIVTVTKRGSGARMSLNSRHLSSEAQIGDSIAVNGTCLTVVELKGQTLSFDVSYETLRSTNLGELKTKDRVNLEPSLRLDSRLGGHFVTGHIDGLGTIESKAASGDVLRIVIGAGSDITRFLVEKGSVAVDGISLTVVEVMPKGFSTVIIPHTAALTTIGYKGPGDTVNIEVDILGKYVSKFLHKGRDSVLLKTLSEEGFM
ncbi:Riboflavin synthase [Candidatus Sulfobium mesophilum]|uniref:Riboflavin synthase n=1 Tax=Candidatus Sulfobium mesophilum TaxID=2016548 RepID=A0A2U3QGC9_9BACT|nr:Riboflavin synthase [Candidatus Sulfobium mesophilum]